MNEGMEKERFFSRNVYIINENKLYARYKYLKEKGLKTTIVPEGEKAFSKRIGISSDELIKLYPLSSKEETRIINTYFENNNIAETDAEADNNIDL